jgi:hypothetical protein
VEVITMAQGVLTLPLSERQRHSYEANAAGLRMAGARASEANIADALNLAEFVDPPSLVVCRKIEDLSKSDRMAFFGALLDVRPPESSLMLELMLNTVAADRSIVSRDSLYSIKSLFESCSQCACTACSGYIWRSIIVKAVHTAGGKSHLDWAFLKATRFRPAYGLPLAAFMLCISTLVGCNSALVQPDTPW